jgi:hypothetical protein
MIPRAGVKTTLATKRAFGAPDPKREPLFNLLILLDFRNAFVNITRFEAHFVPGSGSQDAIAGFATSLEPGSNGHFSAITSTARNRPQMRLGSQPTVTCITASARVFGITMKQKGGLS